jgi:hypothetical protein
MGSRKTSASMGVSSSKAIASKAHCLRNLDTASFSPKRPDPPKRYVFPAMSHEDQTYDEGRARNLEALLRALAQRIQELDREGRLLAQAGELMKLTGDIRSELFHYEVRITYDTPEVKENRRIVAEAKDDKDRKWEKTEWKPGEEGEGDPEW